MFLYVERNTYVRKDQISAVEFGAGYAYVRLVGVDKIYRVTVAESLDELRQMVNPPVMHGPIVREIEPEIQEKINEVTRRKK